MMFLKYCSEIVNNLQAHLYECVDCYGEEINSLIVSVFKKEGFRGLKPFFGVDSTKK